MCAFHTAGQTEPVVAVSGPRFGFYRKASCRCSRTQAHCDRNVRFNGAFKMLWMFFVEIPLYEVGHTRAATENVRAVVLNWWAGHQMWAMDGFPRPIFITESAKMKIIEFV